MWTSVKQRTNEAEDEKPSGARTRPHAPARRKDDLRNERVEERESRGEKYFWRNLLL